MTTKNQITEDQHIDPSSDEAADLMIRLERARSILARMLALELDHRSVTPEQASVLSILLSRGGTSTCDEIADIAIRQYRSIASMVNRMSKIGLVKKTRATNQNRYDISITEEGKRVLEDMPLNAPSMFFSVLLPDEREELSGLLQKVTDHGRELLGMNYVFPFLSGASK